MTKVWRVGHAENQQEFIMLQYTIGGKPTEFRQYCCNTVANSRRYTLQSRNDAHDSTYESKCGGLAMAAARQCAPRERIVAAVSSSASRGAAPAGRARERPRTKRQPGAISSTAVSKHDAHRFHASRRSAPARPARPHSRPRGHAPSGAQPRVRSGVRRVPPRPPAAHRCSTMREPERCPPPRGFASRSAEPCRAASHGASATRSSLIPP
ncbi:hypothetical protein BTRA_1522 [Burkholderia thailandensis USAMRU Malaysia |nr:hypothetical protein BTQ_2303 [Burkholderia thailandensis 2002721723]AIC87985.1 hypothetical protein BTRA_1522 [Burkholderia thailandensis USAMRU Malaysia \